MAESSSFNTGEPSHTRFVWFDRNGEEIERTRRAGRKLADTPLAQGDRAAFSRPDPQTGNRDVWSIEIGRGITARLTTHVANDWYPVWSPDGRQLLFGSDRDGGSEVRPYLKTSMDPGSSESPHLSQPGFPHDWAANGRWMVYERSGDLFVGPASAAVSRFPSSPRRPRKTSRAFRLTADGSHTRSNESGRMEVYVRPFSGAPAAPTGKLQVSHNGGEYAVWGPFGRGNFLPVQRWLCLLSRHPQFRTDRNPPNACAAVSNVLANRNRSRPWHSTHAMANGSY